MIEYNEELLGRFTCRALEKIDTFEANGNLGVNLYFEILEGEHAREVLRYSGFLSETSAEYTIKDLKVAGWQGTCSADLSNPLGLGLKVTVEAKMRKGNDGKMYRNVRPFKFVDVSSLGNKLDALFAKEQQEAAVYQAEARQRDDSESPFGLPPTACRPQPRSPSASGLGAS